MGDRWALAFCVAALLALVGASALRRAARQSPAAEDLRRIGGVVLLAALAGWAFAPRPSGRLISLAAAAVLMAAVGFMADRGFLRGRLVLAAIVAVSVIPVAAGVRFDLLGVPGTDAVVSAFWIAGVTAAVAGLGNTDGLLAIAVSSTAAGAFALAAFAHLNAVATIVAGLGGAAVGFLAYNVRPASLYVGQTGGLVAGFLLAGAVAEVRRSVPTPESYLVPFLLLGLPLCD